MHEGGNSYQIVHFTPGTAKDEAGRLGPSSAPPLPFDYPGSQKCDHGNLGFPKSFWDPVKKRRLQYGWVQGPGLQGEDDSTLAGTQLSLKNNHQSLLREVTYDPRLGMLNFSPIEELALLRGEVLAQLPAPKELPAGAPVVSSPATVGCAWSLGLL